MIRSEVKKKNKISLIFSDPHLESGVGTSQSTHGKIESRGLMHFNGRQFLVAQPEAEITRL